MVANKRVQMVSDDVTCPAPSSFNWAEDVDATVTPIPITLVTPAAHAPCDFSVLHSSNRNPWGNLSRHHCRFQPCKQNSFYSCWYNTNYTYKPAMPSSLPAPIQLMKTIQHPCGIVPTKPIIRTISPSTSTPIIHPSISTPSCKPLSGVHSNSSSQPLGALLLDWSGDPLLAGFARILEALGWIRDHGTVRTLLCLRGAHGVVDTRIGSCD
jgi:hypothetical protein